MKLDHAISELKSNNWREFPSYRAGRSFFKRFETPTKCQHNDNFQVEILVYEPGQGEDVQFQIEVRGETVDGIWVNFIAYSVFELEKAFAAIPKLLKCWECANKG